MYLVLSLKRRMGSEIGHRFGLITRLELVEVGLSAKQSERLASAVS